MDTQKNRKSYVLMARVCEDNDWEAAQDSDYAFWLRVT